MDRRSSLKSLVIASGALIALPAWARGGWSADMLRIQSQFDNAEQSTLASMADTFIPADDTIGALTVGVDSFLVKLFSDCYEEDIRQSIQSLLADIETTARLINETSFEQCSQKQRIELLEAFAVSDEENTQRTFQLIKYETIRGFQTSKEVMTQYLDYKVAPGHFDGCVDVEIRTDGSSH